MAIHYTLVEEYGGLADIRDIGLLESALVGALDRFAYDQQATLFELAAEYAFGLARNHPFADGNKRIAITVVAMFLGDNGYNFAPDHMDALKTTLRLAAGEVAEPELSRWIKANAQKA